MSTVLETHLNSCKLKSHALWLIYKAQDDIFEGNNKRICIAKQSVKCLSTHDEI